MLYHHDNRDYNEAASEAAKKARERMEQMIERGSKFALATIETVQNAVINDSIVKGSALQFAGAVNNVSVTLPGRVPVLFHRRGLNRAAERTGIPPAPRFAAPMLERRARRPG